VVSKTPCAPKSCSSGPSAGSHRFTGAPGSCECLVCWDLTPVRPRVSIQQPRDDRVCRQGGHRGCSHPVLATVRVVGGIQDAAGPELGPINRGHRPGVLGQPGQNQENCGVFTAGSWTIVTCTLLLSWSNSQRSASWTPWMACLAPLVDHSLAQADCRGRTRLRRRDSTSASRASCWKAMRGTVNVHCPRLTRGLHLANIVSRRSPVSRGW